MMPSDHKMILILSTVDEDYSKLFPMVHCYKELQTFLNQANSYGTSLKKKLLLKLS